MSTTTNVTRVRDTRRIAAGTTAALAVLALLSGCGQSGSESDGEGSASCADVIQYQGHQYEGYDAADVTTDTKIGMGTTAAGCADGGDADADRDHAQKASDSGEVSITVLKVKEVDPAIAVATSRDSTTVYVRHGLNAADWPAELTALVRHG